jgi:hypothetical protein
MSTAEEEPQDVDVTAFFAALREKHRAYWETPPSRLQGVKTPCERCDGTGRAPSPLGHIRCSLCGGSGEESQIKKQRSQRP